MNHHNKIVHMELLNSENLSEDNTYQYDNANVPVHEEELPAALGIVQINERQSPQDHAGGEERCHVESRPQPTGQTCHEESQAHSRGEIGADLDCLVSKTKSRRPDTHPFVVDLVLMSVYRVVHHRPADPGSVEREGCDPQVTRGCTVPHQSSQVKRQPEVELGEVSYSLQGSHKKPAF